ncbi:putative lysyl-tRNA synthetase [Babesia divergens]|uniref:Lysyl-tRNA synthetase n=1 Tax=Babesia divergens TaxID=32595 RepID=A0AAD9LF54_BABDI|nr:putative lysyl-tRNA synthetase [Babesia divergens]
MDAIVDEFTFEANGSMQRQISSRLSKLRFLEDNIQANPYPEVSAGNDMTPISHILDKHGDMCSGDEITSVRYRVYGRIISIRFDGQFVVLRDSRGESIQVMFKRKADITVSNKALSTEKINQILDIGDIITVEGYVKKTNTGELTLVAQAMAVGAKCLLPLPDLFHGLKDVSTRLRMRHLDIMTNPETRQLLLQRSKMVWRLRQFLHDKGFIEVETPILHYGYSGANAKPFETMSKALGEKLYMRIAPEFFLKRLVTGGLADKIFEIGKCFRNEGTSTYHSPEFTMVEIYQQFADANDMMRLTEDIVTSLAEAVGTNTVQRDWTTKSMRDLIKEHTEIDVEQHDTEQLIDILAKSGVDVTDWRDASWGELVCELFKSRVEEKLVNPTHVTDLPRDVAPLADSGSRYSRVFESYIGGMEVAHGCTEECNPLELMQKLNQCKLQELAKMRDKEFMNALAHGMPPTAGLGIGMDRLLMALTATASIKSTQTFPLLKSVD